MRWDRVARTMGACGRQLPSLERAHDQRAQPTHHDPQPHPDHPGTVNLPRNVTVSDPDAVFAGIPRSVETTGATQLDRLADLAVPVHRVPSLRDIDLAEDLWAVADLVPDSDIGRLARSPRRQLPPSARFR